MRFFALILSVVLWTFAPVMAGDEVRSVQKTYSKATITPEYKTVEKGTRVWLAFTIIPRENWHTYWLNAGDTAFPPSLRWQEKEGLTFGDALMQTPSFIPSEPFASYGYKHPSTMLIPLDISQGYTHNTIPIRLTAEWLVCEEICVPEKGEFSFDIAIGAKEKEPLADVVFNAARAAIPQETDWTTRLEMNETHARLFVAVPQDIQSNIEAAWFFPETKGVVHYIADQSFEREADGFFLTTLRPNMAPALQEVHGVLKLTYKDGASVGYAINPDVSNTLATIEQTWVEEVALWKILLFAMLGGVILNIMPCVFPILSLKALSFIRANHKERASIKSQANYYTLGILLSFTAIAVLMAVIRSGGEAVGWGFQLQDPRFVAIMVFVMLAVGLSLLGLFTIRGISINPKTSQKTGDTRKESFMTGLLATVLATPCTAPFMAPALGFALTQSFWVVWASLLMVGVGLALPYLVLSYLPFTAAFLPKPGPWLERLKQFFAFPMFLTMAWLLWVFMRQTTAFDTFILLISLVIFALAVWLYRGAQSKNMRIFSVAILILSVAAPIIFSTASATQKATVEQVGAITFDEATLDMRLAANKPVFVYFTADWCITCKVNESMAINRDSVTQLIQDKDIMVMRADWTNRDKAIADFLLKHGRVGVPFYLWYPNGRESGVILPEFLLPGTLEEAFSQTP